MTRSIRLCHAAMWAAVALTLCATLLRAQPGFPPNDPVSWRTAATAKVLCSALFVSGRTQSEATECVDHATITTLHVVARRLAHRPITFVVTAVQ